MADYHKVCWYCGKATMQPIETWYRCKSCGATYVDPTPKGNYDLMETEQIYVGPTREDTYRAYKPTKGVAKAAAKARAKKEVVV